MHFTLLSTLAIALMSRASCEKPPYHSAAVVPEYKKALAEFEDTCPNDCYIKMNYPSDGYVSVELINGDTDIVWAEKSFPATNDARQILDSITAFFRRLDKDGNERPQSELDALEDCSKETL